MIAIFAALFLAAASPEAAPSAPATPDFASLKADESEMKFNQWTLDLAKYAEAREFTDTDAAAKQVFAAYELLSKRFPESQVSWDDYLIQSIADFDWQRAQPIVLRRLEAAKKSGKIDRWNIAAQAWRNHAWDGKDAVFAGPLAGGGKVDVAQDYKGKWVMIQVWDMGCGPCCAEIPHILAMVKKMGDKAPQILGVCLDSKDSEPQLGPFLKARGVTWPQILDGAGFRGKICKDYKIHSIPEVFLVNPDGKIEATLQQDTFTWAVEMHMRNYEARKAAVKP